MSSSSFTENLKSIKISLKDILEATNTFADELPNTQGGQTKIYKGKLSRSEKRIDIVARRFDRKSWRQKKEFMKEITMLSCLKHPNLASIVGFCDEDGEMIIVTRFESKGSLDQYLGDPTTLKWTQRLKICVGIAQALSHIHYNKARNFSVIHSNVKSSKILLDEKWEPKLFGFELSKMQIAARRDGLVLDRNRSGTYAYVDPAYVKLGGVSHKLDVYSLGVVLFEVLCGRKAFVPQHHDDAAAADDDDNVDDDDDGDDLVIMAGPPSSNEIIRYHSSLVAVNAPPLPSFHGHNPMSYNETSMAPSYDEYVPAPSFGELAMQSWNKDLSGAGIAPGISNPAQNRPNYSTTFSLKDEDDDKEEKKKNKKKKEEEKEYMMTMMNLQYLKAPEDGLLAKLAISHYDDENKTLDDIIPPTLRKQMNDESLNTFSEVAYCCLKEQRTQRPNIQRVIVALEQALDFQLAQDQSSVAVEDKISSHIKGKDWENLKIELDVIKSVKKDFIGKGAFGSVFKAELDSTVIPLYKAEPQKSKITVAIKYIKGEQGEQGFLTEIEILGSCRHQNVVSLLGFCYDPADHDMILVYEHVYNGSLDQYLGKQAKVNTNLTWLERLNICLDVARGLNYIHSKDNKSNIIHRDIKSANILLGKNFEAKIADFGLSFFQPFSNQQSTIDASKLGGTLPYMDPEYEGSYKLKKKSDVYSFGVVMFEILTGTLAHESATDENERGLAPIVREHFRNNKGTLKEMVDSKLMEESDLKGFTLTKGPNKTSLSIFLEIGCRCLSEKQHERPTMEGVIKELEKALEFQKTHNDDLRISLEELKKATQNFHNDNFIGRGGFGKVYKGGISRDNVTTYIVAKRSDTSLGQGEQEFLTELEILSEYRHENIVSLIGYCDENKEMVSVTEYASKGSLDMHLENPNLLWTQRLKIAIDVAMGLDFLHGGTSTKAPVIHRDIKSANILLTSDWKAKISDFGLSMITAIDNEVDFMVDDACGTMGYVDPQYLKDGFFTRESDIYSFGVVLFEIMCGKLVYIYRHTHKGDLVQSVRSHYQAKKLDELVVKEIMGTIIQESLTAYQDIAYECLEYERDQRPTASKVVLKLKEALEIQEDIEIWKVKRPKDYKEIIKMSTNPETYSNLTNKKLYEMFSQGILLQKGKVCLSVEGKGERDELVSATMFSYENNILQNKRISAQNSRFQRVVKIMGISNLNIQINIKTLFLSPNVSYGAHLVFKFCDPKAFSSNQMYVNLKYRMGSETLHTYFATRGDNEWMMIELCRFIPNKKDVEFEVLLESLSRYYCQSDAIYVEGIQFRAINDATLKAPEVDEKLKVGVQTVLNSNSDSVPQVSLDYEEITQISKTNGKKCQMMLPAKMVLYDTCDVNRFNWKSLHESRFEEAVEVLSHQVFQIKCKIETQKLSEDTQYACYLVFKLSQQCHGLNCPVKVRDALLRKYKESKFIYFRSPRDVNLYGNVRVPDLREDGLMEVIVWEFNSGKMLDEDRISMSLKLRCYEGTMSGLVVYGIEFRPK